MRIDKIREGLKEEGIGGIVVSNIKNVRYISGFTGEEGMAVVTENNAYLIVDGRFTEQAESESEIEVVDFGVGIEEKDIAHIFEKYYSCAKKFRKVGTGLGLYLSNQIVKTHEGTIEVNSTPNEKTVFTIKLPRK